MLWAPIGINYHNSTTIARVFACAASTGWPVACETFGRGNLPTATIAHWPLPGLPAPRAAVTREARSGRPNAAPVQVKAHADPRPVGASGGEAGPQPLILDMPPRAFAAVTKVRSPKECR
jgi:hypothetical protein